MKKGSVVNYGAIGMCVIKDRSTDTVMGTKYDVYVLHPIGDPKTIYSVPVNNALLVKRMREPLTAHEIDRLIARMPDIRSEWIEDERARRTHFNYVLADGTHDELLAMIVCLSERKAALALCGKKLRSNDNVFFIRAKAKLCGEIAYVRGITPDKAEEIIGL